MQLNGIHRYPVKSCRGEAMTTAVVEPWGLAGDRRWMLVDPAGTTITAREVNRMLLVHPVLSPGPDLGLRVTAPGLEPLDVAVPDGPLVPVGLWGSSLLATPADAAAHAWFSAALGREARLVHLDDPTRRPTDPDFSEPGDRVSFADGYPLLVTTEESLAALNDVVLEQSAGALDPLAMHRFRPNVVVSGAVAWDEDDWRRVRIGDAVFRAVKGCARCVMTTIDLETAQRGKEPIASLARTRRWDGKTWFGVNLVPDVPPGARPGARPVAPCVITVGDPVEVLDRVAPGGGPLRAATGPPG